MIFNLELHGQLARRSGSSEQIADGRARCAASAQPAQSIRRAVGRRMIRIGARLAAEPSLEPARSR